MVSNQSIFLDVSRRQTGADPVVYAKQNDSKSRQVTVTLTDKGEVLSSLNANGHAYFGKPRNQNNIVANIAIENGVTTFLIPKNALRKPGMVSCEIAVTSATDSDEVITTASFGIFCDDYLNPENAIPGADGRSLIDIIGDVPDGKTVQGQINELNNKKVDKVVGKGLSTNDYTDEAVAEVAKIANKVDKVEGKELSTNDYTDSDKSEVAKIAGKLDRSLTKLTVGSPDNIDSLPTENGKSAYYYSDTAFGIGGTFPSGIGRLDGFVLKEHRGTMFAYQIMQTSTDQCFIRTFTTASASWSEWVDLAAGSGGGGTVAVTKLTNEDLDSITVDYGEYYAESGNTCANKPSGIGELHLTVLRSGTSAYMQIVRSAANNHWFRTKYTSGVWGAWQKIYATTTKPTKAELGLGNVDNTSDLDKPISTATQAALNDKMSAEKGTFTANLSGTYIQAAYYKVGAWCKVIIPVTLTDISYSQVITGLPFAAAESVTGVGARGRSGMVSADAVFCEVSKDSTVLIYSNPFAYTGNLTFEYPVSAILPPAQTKVIDWDENSNYTVLGTLISKDGNGIKLTCPATANSRAINSWGNNLTDVTAISFTAKTETSGAKLKVQIGSKESNYYSLSANGTAITVTLADLGVTPATGMDINFYSDTASAVITIGDIMAVK